MRNFWKLLMLVAMGAGVLWTTQAQEVAGSIRGTINDASGAIVSNAKVTAIQKETGLQRSTTSNAQGVYVLVELPVGHYRLEADAKGFQDYVQEGISLDVNQTATVAIHLAVGTTVQQIEVKANAPMIESTFHNSGTDGR